MRVAQPVEEVARIRKNGKLCHGSYSCKIRAANFRSRPAMWAKRQWKTRRIGGPKHKILIKTGEALLAGCQVFKARLKPIADAGFGHKKPRAVGIGFDLLSQLANENSQGLDVVALASAPDILEQLVVSHHQTDMRRQNMKQAIFLSGQLYPLLVQGDGSRHQIDRERARHHDGIFGRALEISTQRGL